jgi:hypothetical protein
LVSLQRLQRRQDATTSELIQLNINKKMKTKNKILLTTLILFSINNCFAQLKVFSNNKVLIGPLWITTLPTEQLFVNGDAYFNCFPAIGGFYFKNYNNIENGNTYDDPGLIPQHANGAWLGTSLKPYYRIFGNKVYANEFIINSDSNLKTNILPLSADSALVKVLALKGFTYNYKISNSNDTLATDSVTMKNNQRYLQQSSNQIGLLAQQVKDVVPEAVKTDEITGNYSVNYIMLIPMLIESIKKQQEQIDLLKQEVILLRDK